MTTTVAKPKYSVGRLNISKVVIHDIDHFDAKTQELVTAFRENLSLKTIDELQIQEEALKEERNTANKRKDALRYMKTSRGIPAERFDGAIREYLVSLGVEPSTIYYDRKMKKDGREFTVRYAKMSDNFEEMWSKPTSPKQMEIRCEVLLSLEDLPEEYRTEIKKVQAGESPNKEIMKKYLADERIAKTISEETYKKNDAKVSQRIKINKSKLSFLDMKIAEVQLAQEILKEAEANTAIENATLQLTQKYGKQKMDSLNAIAQKYLL